MRIGVGSNFLDYIPDCDTRFAGLKALGFDAVDFKLTDIRKPWFADRREMERMCAEARAAAEKHGLEIFQIHGPWPTDDTTPQSRAIGWECMRSAVYGCHLLGSRYMVIHPQMPYGTRGPELDADYAEALTVELMQTLLPDCEKYGVVLCLENMPFKAQRISTTERVVEAVKKVDSPYVGICYDVGHSNELGEDLSQSIRLVTPWLKVLHIHDNRNRYDDHLSPFLGLIDWQTVTKALAESGFDGVMNLEIRASEERMSPGLRKAYEQFAVEGAKQLAQMVEEYKK